MSKHDENYWRHKLSKDQFYVLRQKGTEAPFTGKLWNQFQSGIYKCAGCKESLFESQAKFESGCGWPSFNTALDKKKIRIQKDLSHGMIRNEVLCANCGGHLGHIFDDGPAPTGLRFCINSTALEFDPQDEP